MAAAILDFTRLFLTVQVLTALQYLSGTYGWNTSNHSWYNAKKPCNLCCVFALPSRNSQQRGNDFFIGWTRICSATPRSRGEWGGGPRWAPPAGSGQSAGRKRFCCISSLKEHIWWAKNLIFFLFLWHVKVHLFAVWGHGLCPLLATPLCGQRRQRCGHGVIGLTRAVERLNVIMLCSTHKQCMNCDTRWRPLWWFVHDPKLQTKYAVACGKLFHIGYWLMSTCTKKTNIH